MEFMSHSRLRRTLLAAVAVGGVILGAASVLARPHSATSTQALHAVRMDAPAPALAGRPANADADTGPGDAESELAIAPESRR